MPLTPSLGKAQNERVPPPSQQRFAHQAWTASHVSFLNWNSGHLNPHSTDLLEYFGDGSRRMSMEKSSNLYSSHPVKLGSSQGIMKLCEATSMKG